MQLLKEKTTAKEVVDI